MGVPVFFAWIHKNYKTTKIVTNVNNDNKLHNNVSNLFIDANCAIHPQCFSILAANKEYREKNKDKIKEYNQKPEVVARRQANRLKNKEKINTNKRHKEKLRRNTDPSYKLITNQRTRITGILKKHKTDKTLDLLGCSAKFLRTYIENKFLEGMTWGNYGKYGWHVDHIIPCSSFNLIDPAQQQICFHYTNLQPLWAIDNLKKSNKIITE